MPRARTGAYARIREQFNVPIGKFEGIEEPLARIAGTAYLLDAARRLTCAALNRGPPSRGHLRHHEAARHRADADRDRRRDGHPWRQGRDRRAAELSRQPVSLGAGRHHRRGRQHPDPQPDHVRAGRDPRASVSAAGDERARRHRPSQAGSTPSTRRSGNMSATASPRCSAPGAAAGPAACSRRRRMPATPRGSIASSRAIRRPSRCAPTWRC